MLFIFPRRKINVFSLKLFPLKVGESYTYKRENLLFQLTSETPLLLSSKKRATRLLFALSLSSPLWPVVTISKWNNEKKGRCEVTYPRLAFEYIPKCVLASIFEELAAVVATKWRRDGGTGTGWSEKEASVNRYRFTHALHA